ncbi:zinc finger and SCAN domain-containing protein 12 isoform X2 [Cephus cinctus]|uniref:Zinc finger and SCAN domain-containing protein 12 isoform X2 n=1 Tax=Cephus cinctus TaxID=211228 RepID=A0AAJ7RH23_CEPCN|nr:zinc finger and SCAN domain-containing protein 12 isoform X2 [Cephus cinctus]
MVTNKNISEDDELPKMMCKKCIFLADSFYCFKQQCESANEKLKKFYKMMTEGNLGAHYGMDEYINHNIYGDTFEIDGTRCKTYKENANVDYAYESDDDYFVEYISEEDRIQVENALKKKRDARRKVHMESLSEIIKNLEDIEVVPVSSCEATSNSRNKNEDKQDIVVFPLKKLKSTTNSNNDNGPIRNETTMNSMKRKIPASYASEKTYCHEEKKKKVTSKKDDIKCSNVSSNIVMNQRHVGEIHNQVTVGTNVSQTNGATQYTVLPVQIVQEKCIDLRAKEREHDFQLSVLEGNGKINITKEQPSIDSEIILHGTLDQIKKNCNDNAEKEKFNFILGAQEDHVQAIPGEFKESKSLATTVIAVDKKKETSDMYSKIDNTVKIIYVSDEESPEDDITKKRELWCSTDVTHKEETNASEDKQGFKTCVEAKDYQKMCLIEKVRKKEEFLVIADMESRGSKLKILDGNLKLYQCTICKSNFTSMPNVLKHNIQEHMTSQNDYSCLICKKVFKDKSLLIIHVEQHSNLISYRRTFYPKSFTLKKDLKKHVNHHFNEKSVHSSNLPFPCPNGDIAFSSKNKQDTHLATMHDRHAIMTCEYCKIQFLKKDIAKVDEKVDDVRESCDKKLDQHSFSKTQLNDQTLLCLTCSKALNQKKIRHDHNSTHASSKLYNCKECSASFTNFHALKRHVASHKKKFLMFPCNTCNKKFVTFYELRKHLRVHPRKFSQVKDISKEDSLSETTKEIAGANGKHEKKTEKRQDVTCNQVQFDVAGNDNQGKSETYDQNDVSSEKTQPPVASEIVLE